MVALIFVAPVIVFVACMYGMRDQPHERTPASMLLAFFGGSLINMLVMLAIHLIWGRDACDAVLRLAGLT